MFLLHPRLPNLMCECLARSLQKIGQIQAVKDNVVSTVQEWCSAIQGNCLRHGDVVWIISGGGGEVPFGIGVQMLHSIGDWGAFVHSTGDQLLGVWAENTRQM